eukprot:CAMPEP_0168558034 /NCGR_PEP_ID=MMETSP0413-20121227/9750_1 /TAXON_ID=136452 /ORGANISM="Filamoeba nolandi, Strain NC-AS-23-1" /LENGTH=646 /DNA_ID=CAMNT_0008589119 /DNA_START=413 /DNA_END=2349 /DNA_ORIENTATION=+
MICLMNNYGDLPFHVKIIQGFINGNNFPPVHPDLASASLNYSFLSDFMIAMWSVANNYGGAEFGPNSKLVDIWTATHVQSYLFLIVIGCLLYQFSMIMTRNDRVTSFFSVLLSFFSGGLGFGLWLSQVQDLNPFEWEGVWRLFRWISRDYTLIRDNGWNIEYGNLLSTVLLTQRSFFIGFPLALGCFIIWYIVDRKEEESIVVKPSPAVDAKKKEPQAPAVETSVKSAPVGLSNAEELRKRKKQSSDSTKAPASTKANSADKESDDEVSSRTRPQQDEGTQMISTMVALGVCVGLFPLVHAHTYLVVLSVGGLLFLRDIFLLRRPSKVCFLRWFLFALVAMVIAIPQLLWMMIGSSNDASKFVGIASGFEKKDYEFLVWFWFMNAGFFPFLAFAGVLYPFVTPRTTVSASTPTAYPTPTYPIPYSAIIFIFPFQSWFLISNFIQLNPSVWDNIKYLVIWHMVSSPVVAGFVTWMWRGSAYGTPKRTQPLAQSAVWKHSFYKLAALALAVSLIFSGFLDVWRIASQASVADVWNADETHAAELVHQYTPTNALILHAPTHNSAVHYAGRKSFVGYPGHLWSHGLNSWEEENDNRQVLMGSPNWYELVQKRHVDYIFIGPQELQDFPNAQNFFSRHLKAVFTYKNFNL